MAIRETISAFIARPAARVLGKPLREAVDDVLSKRSFASSEDLAALRRQVESALRPSGGTVANASAAIEEELASLKKKLSMAMGALQAATSQLMETRRTADEALQSARQAQAQAASALATAESAAEGAQQVEIQLEKATLTAQAPGTSSAPTKASKESTDPACAVPGCTSAHRARGFCGKHYQQWKRSSLENFVNADGSLTLTDGSRWTLAASFAGKLAQTSPNGLVVDGAVVTATAV